MQQHSSNQWDLGRFIKTLSYFGAIPVLSQIDWLQQWLGSRADPDLPPSAIAFSQALSPSQASSQTSPSAPAVLVLGATHRLGQQVVKRLTAQGYRVRAIIPPAAAIPQLGPEVEIIAADLHGSAPLPTAISQGLQAVVYCPDPVSSSQTAPGIQAPNSQAIQHLITTVKPTLQQTNAILIFDFSQPPANGADHIPEIWGAVDDVVMGGISQSSIQRQGDAALFAGTVSTANSGGFASVRTRNFNPPLNLSPDNEPNSGPYDGIVLRVLGDGQRYKFMLRTEARWDGTAYCHSFDTVANSWIDVFIPFSQLVPVFRAKTLANVGPLQTGQISAFQLMLSKFEYDGDLNPRFRPGSFQLHVAWIKAYRQERRPQILLFSTSQPHRKQTPTADAAPDLALPSADWLAAEDIVRQSGMPYTIIRLGDLTDAAPGHGLTVAQNGPLNGSITYDAAADICVQALDQQQASYTTFAVAAAEPSEAATDWPRLFAGLKADPSAMHP